MPCVKDFQITNDSMQLRVIMLVKTLPLNNDNGRRTILLFSLLKSAHFKMS